jgi:hypothetical protein
MGNSNIVGVVEALIVFLVTVLILIIMEMTIGATFDQMADTFGKVALPQMNVVYLQAIGTTLGQFKQIHLIAAIMVIMTAVWVIRVVIFGADYTRYRRGGMP